METVVEKPGLNYGELSFSASIRESAVAVPSMEKEFGQRFYLTHSLSSARVQTQKSCLYEVRGNVWGLLHLKSSTPVPTAIWLL